MYKLFLLLMALFFLLFSCKSERQERIEEAAEEMEDAAEKIADAAEEMAEQLEESLDENADNMADAMEKIGEAMAGNSKVNAINYRELKSTLPKEAAGLPKQKSSGTSNIVMGINTSEVEGLYYEEDEDPEIKIKIVDMGNMSGFMKMGSIGWAMSDFNRESSSGFERTSRIKGYKSFEEFDSDLNRGEIAIIIVNRFLVEIRGRDIGFEKLKETALDFDFSELIDLAEDTGIN